MASFLIYKSSAGSGKTTALVKIMLWLSLRSGNIRDVRQVLAITFTNKAAAELKSRFLTELDFLRSLNVENEANHHLVSYLVKMTGLKLETIKKRAHDTFFILLHDYHLLSVSTIDAFNHRLIRSFSRDLGLKSDFEVELDERALFGEAVDRLLEQLGSNEGITFHITEYVDQNLDDERKVNVKRDLESLRGLVLSDEAAQALQSVSNNDHSDFKALSETIKGKLKSIVSHIQKLGKKALRLIEETGLEVSDFSGGQNGVANIFVKASLFPEKELKMTKAAEKALTADAWFAKAKENLYLSKFQSISSEIKMLLEELALFLDNGFKEFNLLQSLSKSIHQLAVLSELNHSFTEVCRDKNIISISAFNKIISEALRKEPVGFIYESYGNRYHHILIDEFQDTSEMQWNNILPLIGESLARGKTNLIVGDAKQSIYRWRGGKAEQFIELPDLINAPKNIDPSLPQLLKRESKILRLNSNYRSENNIVHFNNFLFELFGREFLEKESPYFTEYNKEGIEQSTWKRENQGYVELQEISKETSEEVMWELLEVQIKRALSSGYDYKDMAILVRSTKKEGRSISEHLMEKGHKVDLAGSLALDNSPTVRACIALLRSVNDSQDQIAKLNSLLLLNSVLEKEANIHHYVSESKVDLEAYMSDFNLPILKSELNTYSVYDAMNTFKSNYFQFTPDSMLEGLLNSIHEKFNGGHSITQFLNWWDNLEDKPSLESANGEGITITTIHKSKGLEYPVVFLPDVNWMLRANNSEKRWFKLPPLNGIDLHYAPLDINSKLVAKGLEKEWVIEEKENIFDNLNLIYVACTRASEALFINYSLKAGNRVNKWFATAMDGIQTQKEVLGFEFFELKDQDVCRLGVKGELMKKTATKSPTIYAEQNVKLETQNWKTLLQTGQTTNSPEEIFGTLFHKVINLHLSNQDHRARLNFWINSGALTSKDGEEISKMLTSLKEDSWFSSVLIDSRVLTERDLIFQGEVIRPDLILLKKNSSIVIDFKTGSEKKSHQKQMGKYAEAVFTIFGFKTEAYLIYLSPLKRSKVDLEAHQSSLF